METIDGNQVVKMARELERLMARRRRQQKKVDDLDERIRVTRKLLRDLVVPASLAAYDEPLPGEVQP